MRTVAIIQARLGSSRLPGKVLLDIGGQSMLAHVVRRAQRARRLDQVAIATSTSPADDAIARFGALHGVAVSRGSEHDVLARYAQAAAEHGAEVVVRLTADCPLLDPGVIDDVIAAYHDGDWDYASNVEPPTYPDGLDTEVIRRSALDRAAREAKLPSEREHVTPYIRKHPELFRIRAVRSPEDLSALRWTVDEPRDLDLVRAIYGQMRSADFGMADVLDLVGRDPDLTKINANIQRNEGYLRSLSEDPQVEEK